MKRFLFVMITVCVVAADQLTKAWISRHIAVGDTVNVLPPVVYLYHATNDGVAWSLFRGHTQLFSAVAIAFCVGVLVLGRTAMQRSYALTTAMAMLLGGSVGNLLDRLRYHYVVDFVDVHIGTLYRWPTFNVADSSITIGMAILVGYFWWNERRIDGSESGGSRIPTDSGSQNAMPAEKTVAAPPASTFLS